MCVSFLSSAVVIVVVSSLFQWFGIFTSPAFIVLRVPLLEVKRFYNARSSFGFSIPAAGQSV